MLGDAQRGGNTPEVLPHVCEAVRCEREDLRRGAEPAAQRLRHVSLAGGTNVALRLREDEIGLQLLHPPRVEVVEGKR